MDADGKCNNPETLLYVEKVTGSSSLSPFSSLLFSHFNPSHIAIRHRVHIVPAMSTRPVQTEMFAQRYTSIPTVDRGDGEGLKQFRRGGMIA